MREYYTPFEKIMIDDLVNNSNEKILPYEFIAKHMNAIAIELLANENFAIVTKENIETKQFREYTCAEKSILDIIYLIDYLEKANLIVMNCYNEERVDTSNKTIRIYNKYLYKYNEEIGNEKHGKNLTPEEFFVAIRSGRYSSIDYENGRKLETFFGEVRLQSQLYISDFIKSHFGSFIYVSSLLTDLKENNFKTPEQRRFEKQRKWTWISIFVAGIIGLAGIILNIVALCKDANINREQLDSITTTIQSIKTELPAVIETKITNDTIKVDVVKPTPIKKK